MTSMIQAEEASSYSVVAGRADRGLILVCDHAGNAFPEGYGTLGLPEAELQRHIAYDIGAAAVTRGLAERLGVPAILTKFSRLLIDPNRGHDDPTLIMRLSDGAIIPGNRHLDAAEKQKRTDLYYRPYHTRIDQVIDQMAAGGLSPALLSIHSFTDNWKGVPRPWHVGVLWDTDDRMPKPLIEAFRAMPDLVVGDNEPYHGALEGDCMWQHGTNRGLPHALIEIRQDLIATATGQQAWVDRIVPVIEDWLRHTDLRTRLKATG